MPSSESSFLRQLSEKQGLKLTSNRWGGCSYNTSSCTDACLIQEMEGGSGGGMRKRVMVVVDQSIHSKHAMMWALTHVTNKADILTLLHITPNHKYQSSSHFLTSLASLCNASKPQVEVEALVIQGPKLATVISQVKKLEVSVLVLGQKNSSPFLHCLGGCGNREEFVEQCINTVDCLTIGVRKQSKGIGGYLISTRWHKDFWLLA